jgi:hypothetical protein
VIGVDLKNATQGWLALGVGMRDWHPITPIDGWGERPSEDHKQGIEVNLICHGEAFGDEPVRVLSGNSKAVTNWMSLLIAEVGDLDEADTIPMIRIENLEKKSLGKGSTVAVNYKLAPRDKWMRRADLDASDEAPTVSEADTAAEPEIATAAADDDNW